MTAERWQQVGRLYQQAVAQSPTARAEFLSRACDGDHDLRWQLDRLLAGIGPYEIPLAPLGAGMEWAEVYKRATPASIAPSPSKPFRYPPPAIRSSADDCSAKRALPPRSIIRTSSPSTACSPKPATTTS